MDQKKAMEIYEYIEEHEGCSTHDIAEACNISKEEAFQFAYDYGNLARGEFIFKLTKKDETANTTGHST